MVVPDAETREASEKNPILIETTPEELSPVGHQPRPPRPRKNMGFPIFFGERRHIDIVLKKEDPVTEVIMLEDYLPTAPRANIPAISPSDFLTPFTEVPSKVTFVAETTLSWSSQKLHPIGTSQPHPDLDHFSNFFIRIPLLKPTYSRCHNRGYRRNQ